MSKPCCRWDHVRECGPIEGTPENEPICACGCSGFDERCGTEHSNHPDDQLDPERELVVLRSILDKCHSVMWWARLGYPQQGKFWSAEERVVLSKLG